MLPDLPDLGLLLISILGIAGLGIVCLALMMVGGLMLARSLAERLPVRAEGTPLPTRRPASRRPASRRPSRRPVRRLSREREPSA
jgi:hypothetical protein